MTNQTTSRVFRRHAGLPAIKDTDHAGASVPSEPASEPPADTDGEPHPLESQRVNDGEPPEANPDVDPATDPETGESKEGEE